MDEKLELDSISASVAQSLGRRLILWAVRWIIGFGIIAVVVHFWPTWVWLWWVGGIVAVLSLIAMLTTHFVLQRRILTVRRKVDELEAVARAIDDEAHDNGSQA